MFANENKKSDFSSKSSKFKSKMMNRTKSERVLSNLTIFFMAPPPPKKNKKIRQKPTLILIHAYLKKNIAYNYFR